MHRHPWRLAVGFAFTLVGLLLLVSVSPLHAEEEWTPLDGPVTPGGVVRALAVAPSQPQTLYTVLDHPLGQRLFRSDDQALTWREITGTLPFTLSDEGLIVDTGTVETLYASASTHSWEVDGGIYRSTDGGLSWTQIMTVGQLIASPAPDLVYAVGRANHSINKGFPLRSRFKSGCPPWNDKL